MTDHQSILSRVTEPKWTPGPWQYRGTLGPHSRPDLKGPHIVENGQGIQLCILNGWRSDMSLANARLIAAAPDMAALLEGWCGLYTRIDGDGDRPVHVATLALLAKIKGDAT